MNDLAIKVYKPDYSFIIDNYLDPSLWGKEYTLYEYKEFKATIQLESIEVTANALTFVVKTPDKAFGGFERSRVLYKMNHPEYTVRVLMNKINHEVENGLKKYFGFKNYEPTYELKKQNYHDEYVVYYNLYQEEVGDLYDDLPDLVKSYFGNPQYLLKEIVENKIGIEPYRMRYEEKHYIQELEIYRGIKQQIDNADFGAVDIKIDKELAIAVKQNDGEELTEEEQETYDNWVMNETDELINDFEDIVSSAM